MEDDEGEENKEEIRIKVKNNRKGRRTMTKGKPRITKKRGRQCHARIERSSMAPR